MLSNERITYSWDYRPAGVYGELIRWVAEAAHPDGRTVSGAGIVSSARAARRKIKRVLKQVGLKGSVVHA